MDYDTNCFPRPDEQSSHLTKGFPSVAKIVHSLRGVTIEDQNDFLCICCLRDSCEMSDHQAGDWLRYLAPRDPPINEF